MGEVTMACAGQATARAGFRDTLNPSVSGWASGQSTVIRVRPGPERRGPDSPRAWSLQRGRGQVGRQAERGGWGEPESGAGTKEGGAPGGGPASPLRGRRGFRERGRTRRQEKGHLSRNPVPLSSTLGEDSRQSWSWPPRGLARTAGRGGAPRPPRGWGRSIRPALRALGRGPRGLPVTRLLLPPGRRPPAGAEGRFWAAASPRDAPDGPPAPQPPAAAGTPPRTQPASWRVRPAG